MSLVSSAELKRTFCVTKDYGENDLRHRWPQSTTCLVRCKVSNNYDDWQCITGTNEHYDDWKRFDNTLGETKVHAETHMLNYLYEKIVKGYSVPNYVDICIYINYSPCYKCADVIIDMMDTFKEMGIEVTINIFFANFYKCHGNTTKNESNRTGLVNMLKKGVKLNVFSYKVWEDLLHEVLKLNKSRTFNHVIQDEKTIEKRREREIIDMICLTCLHEKSSFRYPYEETDKEKQSLREVFKRNDIKFNLRHHVPANENFTYGTYVGKKGGEYIEYMKQKRNALEEREIQAIEERRIQREQENAIMNAKISQMNQTLQSMSLQHQPMTYFSPLPPQNLTYPATTGNRF